ncbi:hypothetical protein STRCR_0876 [Streptococcus criceti HS-6]|uniref:Gram-positive cocci surface proteins LPxTG domain-containing protein n=1 Tax=Streptococcus criceti HS-6 TaxID=873449 RepID=G5JS98_STRCG|nr:InlB B-repeat-containing protein [Streptococcus criceti]EHI74882.1 hypothetical protein STRCR_0876 [Streptococcus criceti HS-6]
MWNKLKEKQRFSIRKHKRVGASSVFLGLTLLMALASTQGLAERTDATVASAQSTSAVTATVGDADTPNSNSESQAVTGDATNNAATNPENVQNQVEANRQVTISYVVRYVDDNRNVVYQTTKSTTVTADDSGYASTVVTESGSDMGALAGYELTGGPVSQAITENANNVITLRVSAKSATDTKKEATTPAETDKSEDAKVQEPAQASGGQASDVTTTADAVESTKNLESTYNPATALAEEKVQVSNQTANLKPATLRLANTLLATNSLGATTPTAASNPTAGQILDTEDKAADISGLGITAVNFYNEGTLVSTQYVKNGEKLLEPNIPESGDKVFKGWEYNGQLLDFSQPTNFPTGTEITVNAKYEDTVRVTFVNDKNEVVKVKEVENGATTNADDVVILSPKDSYLFSHWSTTPNGAAFDFSQGITADMTLYAVIVNQKTISFDSNGGTAVNNIYINSGSISSSGQNLPIPTRKGYTFDGWKDKQTGSSFEDTTEVNHDYQLEAQWTANTDTPYEVVYWIETPTGVREVNGIRYAVDHIEENYGTTGEVVSEDPGMGPDSFDHELSSNQPDLGHVKIDGSGETVVNIYAERKKFTLTVIGINDSYTHTYQVKWGTPLNEAAPLETDVKWLATAEGKFGARSPLSRLNYPMPDVDTTLEAIALANQIVMHTYFKDVDTGEIVQVNTNILKKGTGLNLSSEIEGYEFIQFEGQAVGDRVIDVDGNDKTAYFRKKTYKVTFVTNDPNTSNVEETAEYKADVAPLVPTTLVPYQSTKTDEHGVTYLFTGWYDSKTAVGAKADFTNAKVPAGDLVYYAGWIQMPVSVTVHRDTTFSDSDEDKYVLLVIPGNTVLNPDNNYAQTNSDGSVKYDANGVPLRDLTATFDSQLHPNTKTAADGSELPLEWYKLVNGRLEKFDLDTEITAPGTVLVPVWTYESKSIRYDANGGTNAPSTAGIEFLENAAVADQGNMTPPSSDKVFLGWNTKVDGSGDSYLPKETLAFDKVVGNSITLYAQWGDTVGNVEVIYDPNGGDGSAVTKHYATNDPVYVTDQGFTRSGYTLAGYATTPSASPSSVEYKVGDRIVAENVTLYAIWEQSDIQPPVINADDKTVNEKTPFEVPVTVTDNDDPAPSVEVTGLPDGVTYAPSTGKITGSADNESWTDDSDESHDYTVTITATDGAGNSTTKDITITVQRDTDGDGQPDVTDPDDDNDGIPDDKDKNPKVPDSEGPSITAGDKTVNEKTPFEVPVTVTDNDDPAPSVEVTGLPDGVTYAPSTGKITGSADNESWTDDSDESHDYTVTITATDGAGNSTTKDITITVQRDTDGDGQPDVTDPDDDNDGIPDDKDKNPKVPDSEGPSITAGDKTVNEKTPFEVPVTVTDNDDPAPSVEVTGLPDGVTYAPSTGKITGSADNESWTDDSDESHDYTVTITATDGAGNSTTKDITITVQRDTDGDGQPDVTDPDDDNDGIPDDKDKNPKVWDYQTPVANSASTSGTTKAKAQADRVAEQEAKELPKTGDESSSAFVGIGAMLLSILGLSGVRRKAEDED